MALLHDVCKIGCYKPSTRNVKGEDGKWTQVPTFTYEDPLPYGHGEKSVYVVNGYLRLTREEAMAIRWHMGFSGPEDARTVGQAFQKYPLAFALASVVCFEIFAPRLAALFIDDAATIHYAAGFLRRMVLAMPMMSLCYPMIIQFQAMGKVKASLVCSILRKGVLDIPLLFLMDALLPLYGCMWVQPMVDTISLLAALGFYRRMKDV